MGQLLQEVKRGCRKVLMCYFLNMQKTRVRQGPYPVDSGQREGSGAWGALPVLFAVAEQKQVGAQIVENQCRVQIEIQRFLSV